MAGHVLFDSSISGDKVGAVRVSFVRTAMEHIADVALQPSVDGAIAALRQLFRVEVAYTTRHNATHQILEAVEGDGTSFGIADGEAIPLENTYCQRILDGELPSILRDVRADPVAGAMAMTEDADMGAFASVPLKLSDGTLYGTLCCGSHKRQLHWHESDVRIMYVIARLVADQVERDVLERDRSRVDVQATAVTALLSAVDARDGYTGEHSRAVVAHATATARTLNLPDATVIDVEHVAILHDVGKLGVPDAILRKTGPLDATEWEIMREHPATGERIVARMASLAHLAPAIRAEHERWDGGGYPDGLSGTQIPIASRIVQACDAYHAMTSDRPYRKAMSKTKARAELGHGSGSQFDRAVVVALCGVLEHETDGTRIRASAATQSTLTEEGFMAHSSTNGRNGRSADAVVAPTLVDEQAAADAAQSRSDSAQNAADSDQTAADHEQAAADGDQTASDLDQATSDRKITNAHDAHERASVERDRSSQAREDAAQTREDSAALRDAVADARDLASLDRDEAADRRDLERLGRRDIVPSKPEVQRLLGASLRRGKATIDRTIATMNRVEAAHERALAAEAREQAVHGREQTRADGPRSEPDPEKTHPQSAAPA